MGREISDCWRVLDLNTMRDETAKLMQTAMGFTSATVTPESAVKTFSGNERQGVAITIPTVPDAAATIAPTNPPLAATATHAPVLPSGNNGRIAFVSDRDGLN